jgi:hypothetical protein
MHCIETWLVSLLRAISKLTLLARRQRTGVAAGVRSPEVDRLAWCLTGRLSEILPPGEFEVTLAPGGFTVIAVGGQRGSTFTSSIGPLWKEALPVEQRIELYLEGMATRLQRFVTHAHGAAWPASGMSPHVTVDRHAICLRWNDARHPAKTLSVRPIAWQELGLASRSEDAHV